MATGLRWLLAAIKREQESKQPKTRDQQSRVFVLCHPKEVMIMAVRGLRGATTVEQNEAQVILDATQVLLEALLQANPGLRPEDVACAFFTLTEDLNSAYPAEAARRMGWTNVPMLCAQEIPVPGSLPACIRVLLQWNTDLPQQAVRHVYLGKAARLRPDLAD
jgi:chorismate mutase